MSQNEKIKDIEKQIDTVDEKIAKTSKEDELQHLNTTRNDLCHKQNEYYTKQAHGAQIRSRCKWIEEGEKNTSYFLNLEKCRQTNNKISAICTKNGHYVYNSEDILHEGHTYYEKLYSRTSVESDKIQSFLNDINTHHVLSDNESDLCEGVITENECSSVLKNMGKNKSPGYDGIPTEFYLKFWDSVKDYVIDSFNEAFYTGDLSETQKQIVMSLLLKKMKDTYLKIIDQLVYQMLTIRF